MDLDQLNSSLVVQVFEQCINALQKTDLSDLLLALKDDDFSEGFVIDLKQSIEGVLQDTIAKIPKPAEIPKKIIRPGKKIMPRRQTHGHSFNKVTSVAVASLQESEIVLAVDESVQIEANQQVGNASLPLASDNVIPKRKVLAKKLAPRRPTHTHAFNTPSGQSLNSSLTNLREQTSSLHDTVIEEDNEDEDESNDEGIDDNEDNETEEEVAVRRGELDQDVLLSQLESTESQLYLANMEIERLQMELEKSRIAHDEN